jgi:hypothetical protein
MQWRDGDGMVVAPSRLGFFYFLFAFFFAVLISG